MRNKTGVFVTCLGKRVWVVVRLATSNEKNLLHACAISSDNLMHAGCVRFLLYQAKMYAKLHVTFAVGEP